MMDMLYDANQRLSANMVLYDKSYHCTIDVHINIIISMELNTYYLYRK